MNFFVEMNYLTECESVGDDEYESQRNLVYFNAKKNENRGLINPKIRESIVAIKLIDTNMDSPISL